jgi:hypothetical protein
MHITSFALYHIVCAFAIKKNAKTGRSKTNPPKADAFGGKIRRE